MWDTGFAHADKAEALHDSFLESLPRARQALHERVTGRTDIELDGTVASLVPLQAWFLAEILRIADEPTAGLPVWWNPETPTAETGDPQTYPFTRSQLALIDEVQAYYAAVLQGARPDVPWVVYKAGPIDINNGRSMLKHGPGQFLSPHSVLYSLALGPILSRQPNDSTVLVQVFDEFVTGAAWRRARA